METKRIKFGENGIMNTSPHDMHVYDKEKQCLVVFEKGPVMVRCNQTEGEETSNVENVRVRRVGEYSLEKNDLDAYKGAKTLLCSTILANFHQEIKNVLGEDVRILVPNSGPTAERKDNQIICKEFLEYGVDKKHTIEPDHEVTDTFYVLAIDVEASGQGLRTNFMTAIGAALVNVRIGEKVAGFQSYLAQPEGTCWEQRCVDEFWSKHPEVWEETKKKVAEAPQPELVMDRFRAWVLEVTKDKLTKIVFDTSGFDQAWVDYYLGDISCLYLLGHYDQPMDISSYMRGVGKGNFDNSGKKAFMKAMNVEFPEWAEKHDHNPENDATCIAKNAAFVWKSLFDSVDSDVPKKVKDAMRECEEKMAKYLKENGDNATINFNFSYDKSTGVTNIRPVCIMPDGTTFDGETFKKDEIQ